VSWRWLHSGCTGSYTDADADAHTDAHTNADTNTDTDTGFVFPVFAQQRMHRCEFCGLCG
jgi:hypothetical protein